MIPVEIFAEATGPAEPFTRTEFRRLCDQCGTKEKIIRAVEKEAAISAYKRLGLWVGTGVSMVTIAALFYFWKRIKKK